MAMASLSCMTSVLIVFLLITPSFSRLSGISVNYSEIGVEDSSLVNRICGQAKNPSMCSQILPHSQVLTLVAKGGVDSGHEYAENVIINVRDAANDATDPQLKIKYSSCLADMNTASAAIANAQKQVGSGDLSGLASAAATAKAQADQCINLFKAQPADPYFILQEINNFEDIYVDIIRIISTMSK
ncbi:pectinesterase inhibitor-like [Tripterygium wilfordii]|uniref:pectinesterase inhibitor-like n=1 Tax=Tripterygium wilfordii TaxID=458696 RepID=UPI0018F84E21|nr:pectinesterase inhibitor-like [Tripterygium wilfordii]